MEHPSFHSRPRARTDIYPESGSGGPLIGTEFSVDGFLY
ncbi:hypothetical protein OOU_Y34scaffold00624g95 [Pyricularia oryzae Y34]|uniref:Uncharacterized protein n=2 Tax=Pyricularia oryzae TaxID=318829 RepID=A0AA97NV52_PYRO3|nr:hypothetical protein OOU_Y34scaffold00624g95 [Pyricularia oryzae Y34]